MTIRFTAALLTCTALLLGPSTRALAHEGHDHKVMGTVTMAAADHVMLKDKDGKDIVIQITAATKILKSKQPLKTGDLKPGTRVVVTASMEKDQMTAKTIDVGAATAPK